MSQKQSLPPVLTAPAPTRDGILTSGLWWNLSPAAIVRWSQVHGKIATLAVGMFVGFSTDVFRYVPRQCFVHGLEVDGGLAEENQQRLEIDVELEFNWH